MRFVCSGRTLRGVKPAAGYLRLSMMNDDSTSIAAQRRLVEDAAAARGITRVVIFEDEGLSGSKTIRRPGRDDMERRIAAGEFSAVIVKSVDRLARSTADFARIAMSCRDTGTALVVSDMGIDSTTPAGALVLGVLSQLAEFEASMIGARVRDGNTEKVRQGRAIGGPVAFGFRNVRRDGQPGTWREVDPEQAAVVRLIAQRLLDGHTFKAVARALNADSVPPPSGDAAGRWDYRSVERVATNPAIAGMRRFRGDLVRDEHGLPAVDPDLCILSPHDFHRLQRAVEARRLPTARRSPESERLLLDGLAYCDACDRPMRRKMTRAGRYVNYGCPGEVCPAPTSIAAPALDDFVTARMLALFGGMEVYRRIEAARPEVSDALAVVRNELATAQHAMLTAPPGEADTLFARWSALRSREAELADLVTDDTVDQLVPTGSTFAQAWAATDDQASRRALLADMLDAVIVTRSTPGRRTPVEDRVTIVPAGGGLDAERDLWAQIR